MLPIVKQILQDLEPILTPVYFLGAWTLLLLLGWTLISAMADLIQRAKQMHQIPCPNCQYFNNDYRLKCTVQPNLAGTEGAGSCPDYRSKVNY
jgi:hypothetical protein